jgi:putative ABC transport system permease protein
MNSWLQEMRLAVRALGKRPGFALVTILTLALGIGASTAIFSVLDAALLRPLPYPDQERIVELRELDDKGKGMSFAQPNFIDLRARSHSFDSLAEYSAWPEAVAGGSEPVRTTACAVSGDFFRVLGVTPVLGRVFASESPAPHGLGGNVAPFSQSQLRGHRRVAGRNGISAGSGCVVSGRNLSRSVS